MTENMIASWNYEDYRGLVMARCERFARRAGANAEEFTAEAHVAYMVAVRNWKPGLLSFESFLAVCVDRALKAWWKKWTRVGAVPAGERLDEALGQREFLGGISDDACEAVRLALEKSTASIRAEYRQKVLRNRLRELGWSASRVRDAFEELREAVA